MDFLLKGILVGFAIAAPVGAIGVLCIRRTLVGGRLVGLATGVGAAAADAIYAFVAAFGVVQIGALMLEHRRWIGAAGGILLIILGIMEWRAKPAELAPIRVPSTGRLVRSFVSTFILTLANPVTILSFAALFAALGLGAAVEEAIELGRRNYAMSALIGGVFIGSLLWWVVLSQGVNAVRHHFGEVVFRWLNRISGTALIAFGLYAFSLFFR
jgi:threonine/homoserine/homoserine lactone efflux protein